ncbi:MAG: hypothetical protein QHJ34_16210, partial [bacterium]|nr:hypothetical protein [bacterium]
PNKLPAILNMRFILHLHFTCTCALVGGAISGKASLNQTLLAFTETLAGQARRAYLHLRRQLYFSGKATLS